MHQNMKFNPQPQGYMDPMDFHAPPHPSAALLDSSPGSSLPEELSSSNAMAAPLETENGKKGSAPSASAKGDARLNTSGGTGSGVNPAVQKKYMSNEAGQAIQSPVAEANDRRSGDGLFLFSPSADAAVGAGPESGGGVGSLDYAGLESLVMAAVGDWETEEAFNSPQPPVGQMSELPGSQMLQHHQLSQMQMAYAMPYLTSGMNGAPQLLQTILPDGMIMGSNPPMVASSATSMSSHGTGGGAFSVQSGGRTPPQGGGGPMDAVESPLMYSNNSSAFLYTTTGHELPAVNSIAGSGLRSTTPQHLSGQGSDTLNGTSSATSPCASQCGNSAASGDPATHSNLFVCGLAPEVQDDDLIEIFKPYGEIQSVKVMLDIHTGKSRCIAFVKFYHVDDAEAALEALNGSLLCGQHITVRVANSRAAYLPGTPTNKTFVRNVPLLVTKATLLSYFSRFGEVTDLSIKADTAHGRGHQGSRSVSTHTDDQAEEKLNIVFVTYSTKEAAARAAEETHTKTPFPECNGVPLLAKIAEDTARRVERLARRFRHATGTGSSASNYSSAPETMASAQGGPAAAAVAAGGRGAVKSGAPSNATSPMPFVSAMHPAQYIQVTGIPTTLGHVRAGDAGAGMYSDGTAIYGTAAASPTAAAAAPHSYAMAHPGNLQGVVFQQQPVLLNGGGGAGGAGGTPPSAMAGAVPYPQIVYMQGPNGAMIPMLYPANGAVTAAGQAPQMSPYFLMPGMQQPEQ